MLEKLEKRNSRLHDLLRKTIDLHESRVADEKLRLCVEHHESLRHIVQRDVEAETLLSQLLGAFALRAGLLKRLMIFEEPCEEKRESCDDGDKESCAAGNEKNRLLPMSQDFSGCPRGADDNRILPDSMRRHHSDKAVDHAFNDADPVIGGRDKLQ